MKIRIFYNQIKFFKMKVKSKNDILAELLKVFPKANRHPKISKLKIRQFLTESLKSTENFLPFIKERDKMNHIINSVFFLIY